MLRYSKDHVWVKEEPSGVRIGLTDYAQNELGEVSFIELPDPGSHFEAHSAVCSVDSLKSTSDIYTPVSGTIVEVNRRLTEEGMASLINKDPLGDGWLFVIKADDENPIESLLTEDQYKKYISE